MHLHFSPEDEAFRREIAGWLERELGGEFKALRGAGGPGNENKLRGATCGSDGSEKRLDRRRGPRVGRPAGASL